MKISKNCIEALERVLRPKDICLPNNASNKTLWRGNCLLVLFRFLKDRFPCNALIHLDQGSRMKIFEIQIMNLQKTRRDEKKSENCNLHVKSTPSFATFVPDWPDKAAPGLKSLFSVVGRSILVPGLKSHVSLHLNESSFPTRIGMLEEISSTKSNRIMCFL